MKIAVISDIHGNLEALNSVLDDIKSKNINKIFICGDLAMAGPEPSKTVDFIQNLQKIIDITIIQGNTDEMIAKSIIPPNKIMAEALKYAQENLSDTQIDFLSNLPISYTEKIGQLEILLVHGSPRKNNEDILPGEPIEKIQEMIIGVSADLVFCGHTHLPAGYQAKNQTVVNVGSVGRPFTEDHKACYAILDYPDLGKKEFEIWHEFVEYDYETAAMKLAEQGFEGSDKLAQMLIKATSRYPE